METLDINKIKSNRRSDRLKKWIDEHYDGVQAALISDFNLNQGEISAFIAKTRTIGERRARRLELQIGMPTDYLDFYDDTISKDEPPKIQNIALRNEARTGYIYLDLLDVQAAAGNGVEMIEHPSVVTKMEIQEEWAQRTFGGDLSRIMLITARGTSMSGTIENGDILFVDSWVREYIGEGIYVFARGSEILVKRLQKLHGNQLAIISDNPQNKSETLDEFQANEIIICGLILNSWTLKKLW